jgi:hypothetical protein
MYSPCRGDLIFRLPEPEVAFHRITQLASLESGPSPVHGDNNVRVSARKILVPVAAGKG